MDFVEFTFYLKYTGNYTLEVFFLLNLDGL